MRVMKIIAGLALVGCAALLFAQAKPQPAGASNVITIASPAPLYHVQIMVRAGSADDLVGKEGTANLVARALIDAGFGSPKNPVTKERLAEITRPWGSAALPSVMVDKQTTTFRMLVPKDAFPQFVNQVLRPMFSQPLFDAKEIDRLRAESLTAIQSRLRFEEQEQLGLLALDNFVLDGSRLGHLSTGTVAGLKSITREDLLNFYKKFYNAGNMWIATSADAAAVKQLQAALPAGTAVNKTAKFDVNPVQGRSLLIITQPNAIATGIHFGYPISVKRGDPDYWPLYIANAFLGQHRDSFGRLYQEIREDRGYNYGDYTYVEYLAARPYSLFPPPNTPRTQQYFSMWIRPVGHEYAHFITKAGTAEFERFIKEGLTPEQVEEAKVKVRTLYLNFAESTGRQLGYRLDDKFYGTTGRGYLDQMLNDIDKVTPEQVNAAIKKHFQTANLKFVVVTNESVAEQLANDIANNANVRSKTLAEYHIAEPVPPEKQQMLKQDEEWKAYPLNISRDRITIVKADQMFETATTPGATKPAAQ